MSAKTIHSLVNCLFTEVEDESDKCGTVWQWHDGRTWHDHSEGVCRQLHVAERTGEMRCTVKVLMYGQNDEHEIEVGASPWPSDTEHVIFQVPAKSRVECMFKEGWSAGTVGKQHKTQGWYNVKFDDNSTYVLELSEEKLYDGSKGSWRFEGDESRTKGKKRHRSGSIGDGAGGAGGSSSVNIGVRTGTLHQENQRTGEKHKVQRTRMLHPHATRIAQLESAAAGAASMARLHVNLKPGYELYDEIKASSSSSRSQRDLLQGFQNRCEKLISTQTIKLDDNQVRPFHCPRLYYC